MITFADFEKVDIRVGTIIEVHPFESARKPAYYFKVDLGAEIGIKASCAQLKINYSMDELKGRQVLCVVNFPARQIGPHQSEVLILGVPDATGNTVMVIPERAVANGGRLY